MTNEEKSRALVRLLQSLPPASALRRRSPEDQARVAPPGGWAPFPMDLMLARIEGWTRLLGESDPHGPTPIDKAIEQILVADLGLVTGYLRCQTDDLSVRLRDGLSELQSFRDELTRGLQSPLVAHAGPASAESQPTDGETLVMTATFRAEATPTLVVRDEGDRILQYLCALVSWARPKHVRRIVFAENSNTTFDFASVVRHLEAAGKEVEVLVFDGNKEAARLGKGFGEGEILEYIFNNSRLIHRSRSFYKITGRIFVDNFDLVSEYTTSPDAFRRKEGKAGKPSKVNTVFFKCSRALFETKLVHAYRQVDEPKGVYFEHVYFNALSDVETADFGVLPAFVGQQASTGKIYKAYDPDTVQTARSFM